jgi:hypothetical protein
VIIARSSQEGIVVNLESLWPAGGPGAGAGGEPGGTA